MDRTKPTEKDQPRLRPATVQKKELSEMEASQMLAKVKSSYKVLLDEMGKVIVGQRDVMELVFIAILCKGHVLLEGVPGLGKTLMFKTLSKIMNLSFQHIQFTPDLMPSDILGTEIIEESSTTRRRTMKFLPGPVFCHFLLADEINRTSPKTQAALLQAMQDREVTIGKKTYNLEEPYFVLATQNPIDQEGVYPLPEAQVDRFMFNIFIDYPEKQDEFEIAKRYTQVHEPNLKVTLNREEILELQQMVRGMLISDSVLQYAVDIATATRPTPENPYRFVSEWVEFGAGPRATLNLVLAAKARALLKGRYCVATEDVQAVAASVLRHRIKMNFSANAENVQSKDIVKKILESVPEQKNR